MSHLPSSFDLITGWIHVLPDLDFTLARQGTKRQLVLSVPMGWPDLGEFDGEIREQEKRSLLTGPMSAGNANALRRHVPWLNPQLLGLQRSAGLGDRLGLATPGHVRAVRAVGGVAPIFAQQSIREMSRSGRTAQQVMDDALWGVVAEGWDSGFGADADHLKTQEDIDTCIAAGFTFFTIDPGAYVDNQATSDTEQVIEEKAKSIDWVVLESTPQDNLQRYDGKAFDLESLRVTIDRETLLRAIVKYGNAVAHVTRLYRYLQSKGIPFELEISVDETETPTTHAEHIWIANELQRLGVRWISLAPRFVGRFEKGVDYIGDLEQLRTDLAWHADIARSLGPYKLSLHSGSDKFSVYRLLAEATHGLAHLKTAGTSYLEALRVVASVDPGFFREILTLAGQHYLTDRASYHVSARLDRLPDAYQVEDDELPGVLDQWEARQVLHVTFGSVLAQSGEHLKRTLLAHEEAYAEDLQRHFERHLRSFVD